MTDPKYLLDRSVIKELTRLVSSADHPDSLFPLNTIDVDHGALLQKEEQETSYQAMTPYRRICLTTFTSEGYVNGEGFLGLVQYCEDQQLAELPEAYEHLSAGNPKGNAGTLKTLVEKAFKKLKGFPPLPDRQTRSDLADAWFDKDKNPFKKLDSQFMRIGDARVERMRFVLANQDQFFKS